jgi:hypothetical protein
MTPSVTRNIVTSRLLILQSKRIQLRSTEIRLENTSQMESLRARAQELRGEVERARQNYQASMLRFGMPSEDGYWLAAYGALIDTAQGLVDRMLRSIGTLAAPDRVEVSRDVELLETLVEGWRGSMRSAMARSAA